MTKYTHEQLEAAFDVVKNQDDWRAAIDYTGKITHEQAQLYCEAIRYYTATTTLLQVLTTGEYRIKSVGYRMGPAGP